MPNSITKRIKLSRDKYAIIDADMFDYLNQWSWSAVKSSHGNKYYAARSIATVSGGKSMVRMHRIIMKAKKGTEVDHIDGNGLNNTRENLRPCTTSQNGMNRGKNSRNTSGYKGVTWDKNSKKWRAQIVIKRKLIYLGVYDLPEDAARAYDKAARKYHGDFCYTNF